MFSDILDKEEDRMNLIRDMLKTLTKREENVLRLYFGIDGKRSSLEEIGMDYDLTVNTIKRYKQGNPKTNVSPTVDFTHITY